MTDKNPIASKDAKFDIINDGKLSLGYGTILHPKATLIVDGCSLIIGEYNIIEENVIIKVCPRYSALLEKEEPITIYIGNYNHFRIGSYLQNTSVENNCVINYKCHLIDCSIESNCIVSPCVELSNQFVVSKNSIIFRDLTSKDNSNFNVDNHIKYIIALHALTERKLKDDNKYEILNIA